MRIFRFDEFKLFEGGKALETTRRILKDEVHRTVKDIEERLLRFLKIKEHKVLGSAGHKPDSGDIDIGVKDFIVDDAVVSAVKVQFPDYECKWMKGLEVLSVSWPIKGKKDNGFVQVDIIPIKNESWTDFVYKFPEDSKYSSSHRNWMIAAIVSVIEEDVKKNDDGEVLECSGYMFKLNDGLWKVRKSFVGKDGKVIKTYKKLNERKITDDPRQFVKFVFGERTEPEEVETLESCLDIINSSNFKWRNNLEDIKEKYKTFLDRVSLRHPPEL